MGLSYAGLQCYAPHFLFPATLSEFGGMILKVELMLMNV